VGHPRRLTSARRRARRAGLRLAPVAIAGIVGGLGAASFLPLWATAAVAAAGAALVGVAISVSEHQAASTEAGGHITAIAVRDLDDPLAFGVHPAQPAPAGSNASRVPPFAPRDALDELASRLRRDPFVLVIGESTAGKSRLAFEAVRQVLPDHVLIRPRPGKDMQHLTWVVRRHRRSVIWLDELDLYLGAGGLTTELLIELAQQPRSHELVIIATMRVREYDRYSARNRDTAAAESWRAGRDVLLRAGTPLELARRWTTTEIGHARALADDQRIATGLRQADQFGLAEVIAAGPELVDGWRRGWEPGFHPRGAALVAAAVDCRRMGLHRPLPLDILLTMHDVYLDARGGAALRPESVEAALAWATTPAYATSSLLLPHDNGLLAFDYLIDQPFLPAVPDRSWSHLLDHATPREAYDIGWAAIDLLRPDHAQHAFDIARQHGVPDAEYSYLHALGNAGHPTHAAEQLAILANQYEQQLGSNHARTIRAWRDYARYLGESGAAAQAATVLEDMWSRESRRVGPHHEAALTTRRLLGRFLCESGDFDTGLSHLRHALAASIQALGHQHIDTLQGRLEVARYTAKSGRPHTAAELLAGLTTDLHATLGTYHPLSLSSRYEQARAIGDAGDPAQAHHLLAALHHDQRQVFGEHHPRLLSARHHRARFAATMGNLDAAAQEYREVLAIRVRLSGPRHARTLATRLQLAATIGEQGDSALAVLQLTSVLADCRTALGEHHPRTRQASQELQRWTRRG
jgi:hypothetical protein